MKTITLTEETNKLLTNICAAGAMKIQERCQEIKGECMRMLKMKRRGRYPERDDKETVVENLETVKRNVQRVLNVFKFIKDNDLIEDDLQRQAVDDIIAGHQKFLDTDFIECKTEFEEVFALMEEPDYDPKDYLKEEEEKEEDENLNKEAQLRKLMEMLGMDPSEMSGSQPEADV